MESRIWPQIRHYGRCCGVKLSQRSFFSRYFVTNLHKTASSHSTTKMHCRLALPKKELQRNSLCQNWAQTTRETSYSYRLQTSCNNNANFATNVASATRSRNTYETSKSLVVKQPFQPTYNNLFLHHRSHVLFQALNPILHNKRALSTENKQQQSQSQPQNETTDSIMNDLMNEAKTGEQKEKMKDIANEKIVDTSAVEKGDPLEQLRLKILEESINDVYKQTGKTPGYEEFLYRKEEGSLFTNRSVETETNYWEVGGVASVMLLALLFSWWIAEKYLPLPVKMKDLPYPIGEVHFQPWFKEPTKDTTIEEGSTPRPEQPIYGPVIK